MNRGFEKISSKLFEKENFGKYEDISFPKRKTANSAGYDFFLTKDIVIKPNEIVKIPTGIKVYMNIDEVMMVVIRSSLGFKKNIVLANQVGVIDSDYYNNANNEGHIYIPIKNIGTDQVFLKKGDSFAQGIFTKFLLVDKEDEIKAKRMGGFGSTDKGVIL